MSADTPKCGTYAGWNVHAKAGETPCAACRRANADYRREYRKRAGVREREVLDAAASDRAMRALAKVHRAEYLRLKRAYLSELMSARRGK